jgi:hypothetical protein
MRLAVLLLTLISSGTLTAQPGPGSPKIRSITVSVLPTSPHGLAPIELEDIRAAWRRNQVNLAVETRLDAASVDSAKEVIREMYGRAGHAVRVEHSVNPIPPRSVQVEFQVIELCECD